MIAQTKVTWACGMCLSGHDAIDISNWKHDWDDKANIKLDEFHSEPLKPKIPELR